MLASVPESASILMVLFESFVFPQNKSTQYNALSIIISMSLRTTGVYWLSSTKGSWATGEKNVRA